MIRIERGVYPCINHITENSRNFLNFSANSECEKEQIEYSYFELEKVFGARKASFIKKLNYWLDKCGRDINGLSGKWIYNPTHEWAEQLNCSSSTIKRLIKSLEEQEIVLSKKVNAKKYNQTKWYSLNYKLLQSILKLGNTNTKASEKKWTNRYVQNEPIVISNNRNNYTNNFSNPLKESKAQQTTLTANETKLVERMVELWNKVFNYSLSPIKAYVSKSNSKTLYNVLDNHFAGDLSEWQEYAKKVNSSQFLMGEKETKKNFKAIFSWLIKPETIAKIMNDEYGVGDRELDMNNLDKNIEQKKNDIVNKIDKKISEYLKTKIDEIEEKRRFEEYIKKEKYEEDEDKYKIGMVVKNMARHSLLNSSEYQKMRGMLFESYIMKKYFNMTKLEVRKKLMDKIEYIKENRKSSMMDELIQTQKKVESLFLKQNTNAKINQAIFQIL